jgi:hypothetical protein
MRGAKRIKQFTRRRNDLYLVRGNSRDGWLNKSENPTGRQASGAD